MNILIVGNGFDIAHNLKTSYGDFLKFANTFVELYPNYLKENHSWNDDEDRTYVKFILEVLRESQVNDVYKEIVSELYCLLEGNIWIRHFNEVIIPPNWIDFEKEISRVIQKIDRWIYNSKSLYGLNGERFENHIEEYAYTLLGNAVDDFTKKIAVKNIKDRLLEDLNSLTRAIEIYLIYYVEEEELDKGIVKTLPVIDGLEIDNIISFNYTDTYERIYGKAKNSYDYIHGKANKMCLGVNTCNMVLGIDEYQDAPDKDINNTFIEFKKFYQRIFKRTGCTYRNWLENVNSSNDMLHESKRRKVNLYFYGHSLDVTDKDIIAELILNKDAITTIFYHNRESLGKLIANLVAVIGEAEVIKRTGGTKPSIMFKAINKEDFDIVNE